MKLSLYIIADWFQKRHIPVSLDITQGNQEIVAFAITRESLSSGIAGISHGKENQTMLRYQEDVLYIEGLSQEQTYHMASEALEYYTNWESSLYESSGTETTLQELLDLGSQVLPRSLQICNRKGWSYAQTGTVSSSAGQIRLVEANGTLPYCLSSESAGGNLLAANLWGNGMLLGGLILYEESLTISPAEQQLFAVLQEAITRHVAHSHGSLLTRSVLAQYLSDMLERKSLRRYQPGKLLSYFGWAESDLYCVLTVSGQTGTSTGELEQLNERLERSILQPQIFLHNHQLVGVIHLSAAKEWDGTLSALAAYIPEDSFVWGLSHPFRGITEFATYYAQSSFASSYAIAKRLPHLTARDIGVDRIRRHCSDDQVLQAYLHPDLKILQEYDEAHNSAYGETLYQYLFHACNYTDAANALHLHRNTMIYRINQIHDLITADLNNPEERKLLLLSYLLS